ncbi:MAG: hypothetical protein MR350_06445 [Alphaproteobacteria bacterium]|nr:hypothetical protein [Alphaproteobacteria bacterium]
MRKNFVNYFYGVITVIMLGAYMSISDCSNNQNKVEAVDSVETERVEETFDNVARADQLSEDIFSFICLVEGGVLNENTGENYHCGARWTTWYGVTTSPDGKLLKKGQRIPKATAKAWSFEHLRKNVYPFLVYFKHKLTDEQIIGICLFVYNVGGEALTGYSVQGEKLKEPCEFFIAVNNGEAPEKCVNKMTEYRKSAGKRANGLLKRHWVQGAAYLGILTAKNIGELEPRKFYQTKNFGNYYWVDKERQPLEDENGFYRLRYDDVIINNFFNMNEGKDVTVNSIK